MTPLQDRFGRKVEYIRISLTDRCNMRCHYCMPAGTLTFRKRDELLDADEITAVVAAMAARGLRKVRLTGGEPLLRPEVIDIAARISATPGIRDVAISTNALLLKEKGAALRQAGVRRANISLDSLDPVKFARITGCSLHRRVLSGIYTALDVGFEPVKINIVARDDLDLHELEAFVAWASRHRLHLRFIEEMPFGGIANRGRDNSSIHSQLESIVGPLEPVQHNPITNLTPPYRIPGEPWQISFISPMSGPFCEGCNRVRLSATGFLRLCLDEEHGLDLRALVRSGVTGVALGNAIARSVYYEKPERHHFNDPDFSRRGRVMSQIGG